MFPTRVADKKNRDIIDGRAYLSIKQLPAFQLVLNKFKMLLERADAKCHPKNNRFAEESVKYNIGYYNGVNSVLVELDQIEKDFNEAVDYCKKYGIKY